MQIPEAEQERKRKAWDEFSEEWPKFSKEFPAKAYQYFCIEYACREMFGTPWVRDTDASSEKWIEALASMGLSPDDEILKQFSQSEWEAGRDNKIVTKDAYFSARERLRARLRAGAERGNEQEFAVGSNDPRGAVPEQTQLNLPDFRWPGRTCELISGYVGERWERIAAYFRGLGNQRPFFKQLTRFAVGSFVIYLSALWVCACYVHFPVEPYGFWDIIGWIALAVGIAVGVVYLAVVGTAYAGVLSLFVAMLIAYASAYLLLSLAYLCWAIYWGKRKRAVWLEQYWRLLSLGFLVALALATFVDGSYRFWDRPFELATWAKLAFVAVSGWAAMFCVIVKDRALVAGTRPRVIKWTLGLAIGVGLFVYWHADTKREAYFLYKAVEQDPSDAKGWYALALHYDIKGDELAADEGDEDHSPPDPTPYYEESKRCLDRAAQLGESGFEMAFLQAEVSDSLGQKDSAVAYAREALSSIPSSLGATDPDSLVKWLNEVVTRNSRAPERAPEKREVDAEAKRGQQVREDRTKALPMFVRWVFEL